MNDNSEMTRLQILCAIDELYKKLIYDITNCKFIIGNPKKQKVSLAKLTLCGDDVIKHTFEITYRAEKIGEE